MRNTTITATFCLGVALALFPSGCDGFQAGLQRFGYAMFFMNDAALAYLHNTGGWEIGVGPSVVIVDEGMAKSLTTSTLRDDIYAFVFN